LVLDRIGEERHRHDIRLSAGAFSEAMDHVEGIGGKPPRQTAEGRDEADPFCRPCGEKVDRGGERTAVPDGDYPVLLMIEDVAQIARTSRASRTQREGRFI